MATNNWGLLQVMLGLSLLLAMGTIFQNGVYIQILGTESVEADKLLSAGPPRQDLHQESISKPISPDLSSLNQAHVTTYKVPAASNPRDRPTSQKPLNILVLYPDDWRHDTLGGVGPVVQTPFLNELARKGIRFTHNCVTTSICWVSRASFFMGQWASRHKTWRLNAPHFYKRFNESSWPGILRSRGNYFTGIVGKWQFQNNHNELMTFFNQSHILAGKHVLKLREGLTPATDHARDLAIRFLHRRPKDRPFALTVAFFPPKAVGNSKEPGAQWTPKNSSMTLYANETIPMPNDTWKNMPKWFQEVERTARSRWEERFEGSERYQAAMKNYYRLVSDVDEACRGIVDELKKQDLLADTLIIFTTDNGLFHGEHGMAGKWYPFQESLRVPLIIVDPRMPKEKHDTLDGSLTLNVDLAPTILSAAGLDPDPKMQGEDMAHLYRADNGDATNDEPIEWRQDFFYEYTLENSHMPTATALVRKDFKYIYWPQHKYEQLFDLTQDPMEETDLARRKEFEARLHEMRKRHRELEKEFK